jgi:hypothetical protein
MATATTPISAAIPARRRVPRTNVAAIVPMACTLLLLIGASLAMIPQSTWTELPRTFLVWSTFFGTLALAVAGYWAAKAAGQNPWVAPISLISIYYFFRYGWGTLVIQYCENYPWVQYPRFRWNFHRFGMWTYLPGGCQLVLVFGVGMLIGSLLALTGKRSMLPRFSWPFSEEKLKRRAMLYAPAAGLINLLQFVLPLSIRFMVGLLGSFIYPLIMVGAYYLFIAKNAKERTQWITFLLASVALTVPVGLITGQVNGLMMPVVCMFLGYTIANGAPPWKLITVIAPIVLFVMLPFSSIYKTAGVWTADIPQRLEFTVKRFNEIGYRGRFELALERSAIRFAGANQPALYSRYYPNVFGFEWGNSFSIEASALVPRVLWPDKPIASYELNRYPAKIGMIEYEGNTTALFDAQSEYYLNFGIIGMFLLSIVHGYFWQALYKWFRLRVHMLVGAVLMLTLIVQNEDFYGVGLLLTSMIKSVPVWLILFYLLSRASTPKRA